jgi:NADH-quinone oxidoreductase subunit M
MLFYLAGSVKERFHTLEIRRLGGLLLQAPRMGWILGFCVMASLGLPGLAGFWGEFPALLASYNPAAGLSQPLFRVYLVVGALGTVFAAGYLLWLLQRTAFGVPQDEWEGEHFHDVEIPEWFAWVPLLVLILAIGIYPNFVFHVTDTAVQSALHGVQTLAAG